MTVTVEQFKENILTPLKKTIEQYRGVTLAQFKSLDDIKVQYARCEGLEMAAVHVDAIYNQLTGTQTDQPGVEIIPPQQ